MSGLSNKEANRRYSSEFYFLLLECWGYWRTKKFRGDRRFLTKTQKVETVAKTSNFMKLDFLQKQQTQFLDSKKRKLRSKSGRIVRREDFQIAMIRGESGVNMYEETQETAEAERDSGALPGSQFAAACEEVLGMIESRKDIMAHSPGEARKFFSEWTGVWNVRVEQLETEFQESFGKYRKTNIERKAKARNILRTVNELGLKIEEFVEEKRSLGELKKDLNDFNTKPMKNFKLNLFNESTKSLDRSDLLNFHTKTTFSNIFLSQAENQQNSELNLETPRNMASFNKSTSRKQSPGGEPNAEDFEMDPDSADPKKAGSVTEQRDFLEQPNELELQVESDEYEHSLSIKKLETIAEESREGESRRESKISFAFRKEIPALEGTKKGAVFDDFQSLTDNNSMLNSQNSAFYFDRPSDRRISPSPGPNHSTEFFPSQTKNQTIATIREKAEEHGPQSQDSNPDPLSGSQNISSFSHNSPARRGPFKSEIISKQSKNKFALEVQNEYDLKSDREIKKSSPNDPFEIQVAINQEMKNGRRVGAAKDSPQRLGHKKDRRSQGIFDASQKAMLLQTKSQEFGGMHTFGEADELKGKSISGYEMEARLREVRSNSEVYQVSAERNKPPHNETEPSLPFPTEPNHTPTIHTIDTEFSESVKQPHKHLVTPPNQRKRNQVSHFNPEDLQKDSPQPLGSTSSRANDISRRSDLKRITFEREKGFDVFGEKKSQEMLMTFRTTRLAENPFDLDMIKSSKNPSIGERIQEETEDLFKTENHENDQLFWSQGRAAAAFESGFGAQSEKMVMHNKKTVGAHVWNNEMDGFSSGLENEMVTVWTGKGHQQGKSFKEGFNIEREPTTQLQNPFGKVSPNLTSKEFDQVFESNMDQFESKRTFETKTEDVNHVTSPDPPGRLQFNKKFAPEIQRINLADSKRGIFLASNPFGEEMPSVMSNTPKSIMKRLATQEMSDKMGLSSDLESKKRFFVESQSDSKMNLSLHRKTLLDTIKTLQTEIAELKAKPKAPQSPPNLIKRKETIEMSKLTRENQFLKTENDRLKRSIDVMKGLSQKDFGKMMEMNKCYKLMNEELQGYVSNLKTDLDKSHTSCEHLKGRLSNEKELMEALVQSHHQIDILRNQVNPPRKPTYTKAFTTDNPEFLEDSGFHDLTEQQRTHNQDMFLQDYIGKQNKGDRISAISKDPRMSNLKITNVNRPRIIRVVSHEVDTKENLKPQKNDSIKEEQGKRKLEQPVSNQKLKNIGTIDHSSVKGVELDNYFSSENKLFDVGSGEIDQGVKVQKKAQPLTMDDLPEGPTSATKKDFIDSQNRCKVSSPKVIMIPHKKTHHSVSLLDQRSPSVNPELGFEDFHNQPDYPLKMPDPNQNLGSALERQYLSENIHMLPNFKKKNVKQNQENMNSGNRKKTFEEVSDFRKTLDLGFAGLEELQKKLKRRSVASRTNPTTRKWRGTSLRTKLLSEKKKQQRKTLDSWTRGKRTRLPSVSSGTQEHDNISPFSISHLARKNQGPKSKSFRIRNIKPDDPRRKASCRDNELLGHSTDSTFTQGIEKLKNQNKKLMSKDHNKKKNAMANPFENDSGGSEEEEQKQLNSSKVSIKCMVANQYALEDEEEIDGEAELLLNQLKKGKGVAKLALLGGLMEGEGADFKQLASIWDDGEGQDEDDQEPRGVLQALETGGDTVGMEDHLGDPPLKPSGLKGMMMKDDAAPKERLNNPIKRVYGNFKTEFPDWSSDPSRMLAFKACSLFNKNKLLSHDLLDIICETESHQRRCTWDLKICITFLPKEPGWRISTRVATLEPIEVFPSYMSNSFFSGPLSQSFSLRQIGIPSPASLPTLVILLTPDVPHPGSTPVRLEAPLPFTLNKMCEFRPIQQDVFSTLRKEGDLLFDERIKLDESLLVRAQDILELLPNPLVLSDGVFAFYLDFGAGMAGGLLVEVVGKLEIRVRGFGFERHDVLIHFFDWFLWVFKG